MNTPTKVLIADDHEIFRLGLAKTIERDSSFSTIAQAANGNDALRLIRSSMPDIAVLDISMPEVNGLDVGRAIYQEGLPTEIVFLTMHKDISFFTAAMDIGAKGYVLKDNASADLLNCLKAVAEGKHYISPIIAHLLLEHQKMAAALEHTVPALMRLSPAERRILSLMVDNLTCRDIAEKLCISVRTVENHRNRASQKLGIKGHNQLIRFVLENRTAL
jgi:DNA-binding NarL/FixJ family response regulator